MKVIVSLCKFELDFNLFYILIVMYLELIKVLEYRFIFVVFFVKSNLCSFWWEGVRLKKYCVNVVILY